MSRVDTAEQAYDEICQMIQDAWEDDSETLNIPIVWDNVAHDYKGAPDPHKNAEIWLKVAVLHESARKVSLRGANGSRYEHSGSILASLNYPRGKGTIAALPLISVVGDTFQGKRSPGGVWFRNVQYTNVGNQGAYNITAMTADFLYDQIR